MSTSVYELGMDILSLQSTNGRNPGKSVSVPNFLFSCAPDFLVEGLASGVKGMVGLGRHNISLPNQFSTAFGFKKKLALCLTGGDGVIFFGDGPYEMLPGNTDLSQHLTYTSLILNHMTTSGSYFENETSAGYFIGLTAININGKRVKIDKKLLSIDQDGEVGTKISTVDPYTVLQSSIYKAFTKTFIKLLKKVPRVKAVKPFDVCFDAKSFSSTRVGPGEPPVDFVLQNNETVWRIWGANSMVYVNEKTLCLAFIDGGAEPRTSIVIGGYQLENNLLQFDLASKRLGFSGSLLFSQTTCSNINFTSV
ncbi:hypothetical protein JCGZ_02109 [Jatropha curcas]|uniref:Peptidase A1 domain-containing protein n=1 Tax=Jatropha curcas TaxID=180498 RepID=A0A067KV68_JATCU|nr:hypothetical protein JCGZ_02109 [Jatropha curcas]